MLQLCGFSASNYYNKVKLALYLWLMAADLKVLQGRFREQRHDRRGDDGPTCRGDTDLIDTDDTGQAIAPELALEAERRDDDRHRATA